MKLLKALVLGLSLIWANAQAQNISIATGGTGGVYYPMGGGLAAMLSSKVPGMSATAEVDRKSTRLNSSHTDISRMPSSA